MPLRSICPSNIASLFVMSVERFSQSFVIAFGTCVVGSTTDAVSEVVFSAIVCACPAKRDALPYATTRPPWHATIDVAATSTCTDDNDICAPDWIVPKSAPLVHTGAAAELAMIFVATVGTSPAGDRIVMVIGAKAVEATTITIGALIDVAPALSVTLAVTE